MAALADNYMLGHTKGQVQEAYIKASTSMKKQLMKEKSISVLPSRVGAMMGFGSFGSPTLRRSVGTLSE